MIEYNSLDEYLSKNKGKLKIQLRVTLEGPVEESPITKTKCIYHETATFLYKDGKVIGNTNMYYSKNDFYVIIEKQVKVLIRINKLRTYLDQNYFKIYTIDEIPDEKRKDRFSKGECDKIADVEYILQKDKPYYAMINQDQYYLPPEGPMGAPKKASNTVLWISNKEFKEGKPHGELTPHYRGWTY